MEYMELMTHLNRSSFIKYFDYIRKIKDDQSNVDSNYLIWWDNFTIHKKEEVRKYFKENVCKFYLSQLILFD